MNYGILNNQQGALNLARVDLVSIRLAVLCAELGSLSAASKRVPCSLSAGSLRLSALEKSLGTQLFTRDHRGLQTTQAGDLFVPHGRAILQHVALMNGLVRSVKPILGS
ncbi:LysR family transcriptional regulator [Polaromonas sp. C04]|uniref:LysR family transcriptional regulator n=1 Tax=Polaromonas sp. C04 TaxID=1945857 RepID=UPI000986D5A7|nr:LysR family transcriptional regulator [Polaromonas sp. C04]OOG58000.1 hypothetical protein B0E49_03945 [Polaromonas sp. C04]